VLARQPFELLDLRVTPAQLLRHRRTEVQHALPLRRLDRLRRTCPRAEVDHHVRPAALLPCRPGAVQLVLGPRTRVVGRGAEAFPEDADDEIRLGNVHDLVDQALGPLQMQPRSRIRLPSPQRQPPAPRRGDTAVELVDHPLQHLALGLDVARRDRDHTQELDRGHSRLTLTPPPVRKRRISPSRHALYPSDPATYGRWIDRQGVRMPILAADIDIAIELAHGALAEVAPEELPLFELPSGRCCASSHTDERPPRPLSHQHAQHRGRVAVDRMIPTSLRPLGSAETDHLQESRPMANPLVCS
jgi:hypothetical protein